MGITIRDIAKAANVSINTVSRALNNKGDVNKETRIRIERVARELNYVPNQLARSLHHKRTGTIGVVVTDNSNPFYARLIKGIEDYASGAGYNIILCNSDEDAQKETAALKILKEKQVDGILITPTRTSDAFLSELGGYHKPFILVNRSTDEADVDYVKTDNVRGAKMAIQRLLGLGRRKLWYLGGPQRISSAVERLKGCMEALREAGLPPESLRVIETSLHMEDGYACAVAAMKENGKPDGLFAYSDILAIAAMKALRETGLRIPSDVAVIGYDDIEISQYLEISLTTVRQQRYEIGWKSAEVLIDKLRDREGHKTAHIVYTPELVVRDSA
jgi:LacI family transcriptional regulator